MIKNIIFDWSGVIGNDLTVVYHSIMLMFKKLGAKEISLEEFKREWEQPYMNFYKKYGMFTTSDNEKDLKEEQALYKDCYAATFNKYPPQLFPGIKEALQKFKNAGIKMIVLSSNSRENILSDIENFGLQGIFSEINSDVHNKAVNIKETLQRNGFEPAETVFVGDTVHEVESGKSVGIKTLSVTWGFNNEDKLKAANPDFIAHNLQEFESIILNNMINFEDFKKIDIRIGKILSAERIENSDKLLKLEVDFGSEKRQIVSGIAEYYAPESLIGKEAPFVVNLEPRVLRGVESAGMIMAANVDGRPVLLHPGEEVPPGSIIK